MKWNIALAAIVASFAICSQSFGFDLLDRMLIGSGCGCATKCCEAKASCEDADPSCGCDAAADCGCDATPDCGCDVDPACGCDNGCESKGCGCGKTRIRGLLDGLFSCNRCNTGCDDGCDAAGPDCGCDAEPACGCDAGCDSGCESKGCCRRVSFLDRIFACNSCKKSCGCDDGCDAAPACGCDAEPACGCDAAPAAPASAAKANAASAIIPPTPMIDPSAFVAPQGNIITAGIVR